MITCVLTGEQFLSPSHAAQAFKISLPTAMKSINEGKAILNKAAGYHTWLVGPNTPALKPFTDNRRRTILCEFDNTIFNTMSEAAEYHEIDLTCLSRALRLGKPVRSNRIGASIQFRKV